MRSAMGMAAAIAFLAVGEFAGLEQAAAAGAWCSGERAHDVSRQAPPEFAQAVADAFGVAPDAIGEAAYIRCAGPKLMACWVGANLDCGKADMRRRLPGASAFCRQNPGSDSVPMAATGHATIYDWRCVGARAVAGRVVAPVDAEGYIAANWRRLP